MLNTIINVMKNNAKKEGIEYGIYEIIYTMSFEAGKPVNFKYSNRIETNKNRQSLELK